MPRLFTGLRFFFYPPKALHRLNSVKATASARQGAVIQQNVGVTTTHVIVAPAGETSVFWQMMAKAELNSNCVVVNDKWPSDCIDRQELIDPQLYLVTKTPTPDQHDSPEAIPDSAPENSHLSPNSLEPPPGNAEGHEKQKVDPRKRAPPEGSPVTFKKAKRENALLSGAVEVATDDLAVTEVAGQSRSKSHPVSLERSPKALKYVPQNQRVIEVFHDLMLSRQAAGEEYSERAYERALRSLEALQEPIESGEQVRALPGMTSRMSKLVDDVIAGKLHPMISKSQRHRVEVIQLFTTVYGIGPYSARKLYDAGHRTLADIRAVLDENARVSIDHHQDFVERIARTEVSKHFAAVKRLVATIDPQIEAYCMGSFRRGQLDCGDIDIILTKPGADLNELKRAHKELLSHMFQQKIAVHTFTKGSDRWLGATQVIGRWRRMDILLVPWDELGAALIYYTGNDRFNRELRYHAKRNHMRLNHNGLFRVTNDGQHENLELLESHDERKIFAILGRPFLPPEKRIM